MSEAAEHGVELPVEIWKSFNGSTGPGGNIRGAGSTKDIMSPLPGAGTSSGSNGPDKGIIDKGENVFKPQAKCKDIGQHSRVAREAVLYVRNGAH